MTATAKGLAGKAGRTQAPRRPAQERAAGEPLEKNAQASSETAADTPGQPAGPQGGLQHAEVSEATEFGAVLDRTIHAMAAKLTAGLSPAAMMGAYADWALHLLASPGKMTELAVEAGRNSLRLGEYATRSALQKDDAEPCVEPLPHDKRFAGEAWQKPPFNLLYQGFLLNQQWWHSATTAVRGVTKQHENVVEFATRQILDVFSPSNYLPTNPELLRKTFEEGGGNLLRGAHNFFEDWGRSITGKGPIGADQFRVGRDVAVTPGKVIFRNRLIELIQYAPATEMVRPEPILIVPAWIMKYYILDLSPHNSLVRYLTGQGFTVFMISWRNPGLDDRDLGMEDYRKLGVMAAIDAVSAVVPDQKIHAAGYCLGGTLLSIAAAAMARDGDERLKSLTLLAAQTDFEEAGELMLFINESELSFLEDMMWEQGYLDSKQMAGAFQLLRSNDLVWSRMIHDYLMGEREPMFDLLAWNADATRMPYRMHSEYLRHLFLDNDLVEGRFVAGDKPVALTDIHVPIFGVGTVSDHVAPWRSTFKIQLLSDTDVTYVLTNGGHNAGIVSEPGRAGRHFQVKTKLHGDNFVDPDTWASTAERKDGSWWPEWTRWLGAHSSGPVKPASIGAPDYPAICDAPGTYVLQE